MHARQGFDYPFPDIHDPIFVSKVVIEDDAGRVVMASLARLTCEMYFLLERGGREAAPAAAGGVQNDTENCTVVPSVGAGNPRERYARMLELHEAAKRDLLARGLDDAHAWLPPRIAKRFGRRLEQLGWIRDDAWTPYCSALRRNGK
jgi:hypothetical protein